MYRLLTFVTSKLPQKHKTKQRNRTTAKTAAAAATEAYNASSHFSSSKNLSCSCACFLLVLVVAVVSHGFKFHLQLGCMRFILFYSSKEFSRIDGKYNFEKEVDDLLKSAIKLSQETSQEKHPIALNQSEG